MMSSTEMQERIDEMNKAIKEDFAIQKENAAMLQMEEITAEQLNTAKLYRKQSCRELALATTRDIHGLYKETFTNDVDNLLEDADKIYNWLMAVL